MKMAYELTGAPTRAGLALAQPRLKGQALRVRGVTPRAAPHRQDLAAHLDEVAFRGPLPARDAHLPAFDQHIIGGNRPIHPGLLVVLGRNNPAPYTVNGRPLYVHLNGLAIVLLK
jgi:hypothetical protein